MAQIARRPILLRWRRGLVLLVGIVFAGATCSPAVAQVAFDSKEPLKLDFDTVATRAGRITVLVRNDDPRAQKIELRLTGLAAAAKAGNPNLGDLARGSVVTAEVQPGKWANAVLSLRTAARPNAGAFKATLVATGTLAGSATRPVLLTVAKKPTTKPVAGGETPRLQPQTLSDFTVGATNFVPSLISPLPAATFAAGFLLLLLVWPFSSIWPFRHGRLQMPWVGLAIYAAVLLVAAGAYFSFGRDDGYYEGWSPHRIVANSPAVAPDASHGAVGTLVGSDGALAQAVVRDGELLVRSLPRAGVYKGKVDLLPGVDGGDATMTANVRDFWLYALIVIAAGVFLGYAVTRYFTRTRTKARRRLETEELWSQATLAESAFAQTSPDLFPIFSFHRRLSAWQKEIERLLSSDESDDAAAATKLIALLRTYLEGVNGLWAKLGALRASIDSIRETVPRDSSVRPEDVFAVREAQRVFQSSLDDGVTRDEDSTQLNACVKDVDAAATLIKEFVLWYEPVLGYLRVAAEIDTTGWSKAHVNDLKRLREELKTASDQLLTASDETKVKEAASTAGTKWVAITRLAKDAKPGHRTKVTFAAEWQLLPKAARTLAFEEGSLLAEAMPHPRASLTVEIEGPEGPRQGHAAGAIDDLFVFRAKVEMPRLVSTASLHWSFGDGTKSEDVTLSTVGKASVEISIPHRYERSGRFEVELHDNEGPIGDDVSIDVSGGPPRWQQMRARFLVTDRDMTLASGLLAVFAGLLTLYATSPTWGSPGDYMKAFFWGSTVSEGVKYVTALITRTGSTA